MAKSIRITTTLWEEMKTIVKSRLMGGKLGKPIVFALYTKEKDHREIIEYREIPTVKVTGDYLEGKYDYTYPGIKNLDFYVPAGGGKWFSGTLVVGDGTELEDDDKKWMIREQLDFRIKMVMDSSGKWCYKSYFIDFPDVSLDLIK